MTGVQVLQLLQVPSIKIQQKLIFSHYIQLRQQKQDFSQHFIVSHSEDQTVSPLVKFISIIQFSVSY